MTEYRNGGNATVTTGRMRFHPVIHIDPNVRVNIDETFSGFEDIEGDQRVHVGQMVGVYEPESGLRGTAVVTHVNDDRRLVYLNVDWRGLQIDGTPS